MRVTRVPVLLICFVRLAEWFSNAVGCSDLSSILLPVVSATSSAFVAKAACDVLGGLLRAGAADSVHAAVMALAQGSVPPGLPWPLVS